MVGDLERERGGLVAEGAVDVKRVEDLGHLVGGELDVDDRADDPRNAPDPAFGVACVAAGAVFCDGHV